MGESISALLERADVFSTSGANAVALTLWERALEQARTEPDAYLSIIRHHFAKGRRGQVTRAYRLLSALAPHLLQFAPFDPPDVTADGSRPALSLEEHLQRGQLLQIVGDIKQAEQHFLVAQALSPAGDGRATLFLYYLRPWSQGAHMSEGQALALFAKAYNRDLESEDHRKYGGLNGHLTLGRLVAHGQIRNLAREFLYDEATLLHRVYLLILIGNEYAAALGVAPDEIAWLAEIEKTTRGRDLLADAARLYEAVIGLEADYRKAWQGVGEVRLLQGNLGEAEKCFERSHAIEPTGDATLRLAAIREMQGNISQAARLYQESSARMGGELGTYHRNAGRCLRQAGRHAEALAHFEKAMGWSRWLGPEFNMEPLPITQVGIDAIWSYIETAKVSANASINDDA